MTLDQFPIQEMVKILTEKYMHRKEYFSHREIARFIKEINDELLIKYSDRIKHEYLVEKLTKIKNELSDNNMAEDINISGFEIIIKDKILDAIRTIDLDLFEFSNQPNIDVMQDIIERCYFYIDEINLLSQSFEDSDNNEWEELINNLISKSDLNNNFLNDINKRFHYDLIDENDNQNVDSFSTTFSTFYDDMAQDLFRVIKEGGEEHVVLRLYVEGEPIPDEVEDEVIGPKSLNEILVSIQQLLDDRISNINNWIEEIENIKKKYDENAEDINFDKLLRKITFGDHKIQDNDEFIIITKRDLVIKKIKDISLGLDDYDFKYTHKPEIKNLVLITSDITELRIRLIDCYDILLKGDFIEECHPIIFRSLFEKEKFIAPVNWIGSNKELNYFIIGIVEVFKENKSFWPEVHRCFIHNGKPFGKDSIRSYGKGKPLSDNTILVLDKAINSIIY